MLEANSTVAFSEKSPFSKNLTMSPNEPIPPERQFYLAVCDGDSALVRHVLTAHPELYGSDRRKAIQYELKHAVATDSPDVIDVLVDFGADVNAPFGLTDPEGIIEETCLGGAVKLRAARRLLELGAQINFDTPDGIRCRTLIFAICSQGFIR